MTEPLTGRAADNETLFAALAEATALPTPAEPFYAWAVGEQSLPTAMRRHWVRAGVPKGDICFCGYWRHSARH